MYGAAWALWIAAMLAGFGVGPAASAASVLRGDGTVGGSQKISAAAGGLGAVLDEVDGFGWSAASLGDFDGDGVGDVAVGALYDDDGSFNTGAVWVLFLNADGTVAAKQKISATAGGFAGLLAPADSFGSAVASIGDLNHDGVGDLAVGAFSDNDGADNTGAVWVLFLNADATVNSVQKISATSGDFAGTLDTRDNFGSALASVGDLDGDGIDELAVGAYLDDDGHENTGAVWVLFLNGDGTVRTEQKISATAGGFSGTLDSSDFFGLSLAALGDLDGDGVGDLAVGAPLDDDGVHDGGAVWILFLQADGTVKTAQKISATAGGFSGTLATGDLFGFSVASLGDLDGDGTGDLAVGALFDDDGAPNTGALWVLFLNANGTVKTQQKISATAGGFAGPLDEFDSFGTSVASLGDLDGDGVGDLLVGAYQDDDGAPGAGAAWVLFLHGALPRCGDWVQDPGESCDDGNLAAGDGCTATCVVERFVTLSGLAQGGRVVLVVDGLEVDATTTAGQTPAEVVQSLATAFALAGLSDLVSVATGETLWLVGALTEVRIEDAGLGAQASPPAVVIPEPIAPALGFAALVALAALRAGTSVRHRRSHT